MIISMIVEHLGINLVMIILVFSEKLTEELILQAETFIDEFKQLL